MNFPFFFQVKNVFGIQFLVKFITRHRYGEIFLLPKFFAGFKERIRKNHRPMQNHKNNRTKRREIKRKRENENNKFQFIFLEFIIDTFHSNKRKKSNIRVFFWQNEIFYEK